MTENKFHCCLCNSNKGKNIPFRYIFKGRYLNGVKCSNCNLISIFPHPTDSEINEMYSEEYYTGDDTQTHHGSVDYFSATKNIDYSTQINLIKSFKPSGHILEVGCATGSLLNSLRKTGYQVTGIEISEFSSDWGRKNFNIDILTSPFDETVFEKGFKENTFDIILMGDVLEHFKNPMEAVKVAYKLLRKDGVLIAHVPSTLNLISSRLAFIYYRLTGKQMTMKIAPFHLTEFSPDTLRRIYKENGLRDIKIIQRTKHPRTISLRHSWLINTSKLLMQYPNYYLTKLFGIFGDRITGVGYK